MGWRHEVPALRRSWEHRHVLGPTALVLRASRTSSVSTAPGWPLSSKTIADTTSFGGKMLPLHLGPSPHEGRGLKDYADSGGDTHRARHTWLPAETCRFVRNISSRR